MVPVASPNKSKTLHRMHFGFGSMSALSNDYSNRITVKLMMEMEHEHHKVDALTSSVNDRAWAPVEVVAYLRERLMTPHNRLETFPQPQPALPGNKSNALLYAVLCSALLPLTFVTVMNPGDKTYLNMLNH